MPPLVSITVLTDRGDERGSSFSVDHKWSDFLPSAVDLHLTTLHPGAIRGNHFHKIRKEVIVILHKDEWTLRWDLGIGSPVEQRRFTGGGAVLLTVEPLVSHAIINSGGQDLYAVALTDAKFDPEQPDTYLRTLV